MKLAVGVTAATILAICSAQAECITELPKHRTGHWKYRYEHHQRCWFGPGMAKQSERVATDLPALSRRHREDTDRARTVTAKPSPSIKPKPIPSISEGIEEEIPDPVAFEARRVKTVIITKPPSVSRRLEDTFEDMARRCEVSIDACRDFK